MLVIYSAFQLRVVKPKPTHGQSQQTQYPMNQSEIEANVGAKRGTTQATKLPTVFLYS